MQRTFIKLLTGLGLAACAALAHAQYPTKPISMVVSFPPGGTSDSMARIIAKNLSDGIGQPVIVENKPGAEGQIAAMDVMKAAPDGYRIGFVTSGNLSALPAMRNTPPYDPATDFTAIADIGRYAFFLFTHPKVPAKTFKEFIEYAKANPDTLSYGTGNATGVLAFAQLKSMFGIDLLHVPYKGEPPATTDLVSGRVDAMIGTGAGLPYAKDGRLRTLVTLLPTRSPLAPDVPVLKEIGMGELPVIIWAGIVGPKGMPKDVVDRLNQVINASLAKPDVRSQIEQLGFAVTPSKPDVFAAMIKEQVGAYESLVNSIGMKK
ncbi:tripartite tricarboxylate transporter substrate binding protein [Candidimonas sp. SYP-B2681]|uniref:Bug family tripartite tricarboxylate transporter substrate binding protein n=1 Tax=Candidimonas sp. SYP-B2681 TaxID=2497686 RepID=UPI000F8954C6|nr:tripartite tricarboxylate transporter substrate binding protein [Candidimonas sp. SYP-B2681]RTZ43199.1 tripartite tricarboxylate transporter substrate binding protein [Candidimonas sp. SYP-B2681]